MNVNDSEVVDIFLFDAWGKTRGTIGKEWKRSMKWHTFRWIRIGSFRLGTGRTGLCGSIDISTYYPPLPPPSIHQSIRNQITFFLFLFLFLPLSPTFHLVTPARATGGVRVQAFKLSCWGFQGRNKTDWLDIFGQWEGGTERDKEQLRAPPGEGRKGGVGGGAPTESAVTVHGHEMRWMRTVHSNVRVRTRLNIPKVATLCGSTGSGRSKVKCYVVTTTSPEFLFCSS